MEVQSRLVGITIGSRTNRWREALEQQAGKVFETPQEDKRELKQLKAQNERLLHKVGQLTIDCDFFCTSLRRCRYQSEIADLERHRPAGMSRHRYCLMMHLTRSNLYYKKKVESEQNLRLMQEIDRYKSRPHLYIKSRRGRLRTRTFHGAPDNGQARYDRPPENDRLHSEYQASKPFDG